MTMATYEEDPEQCRPTFAALRHCATGCGTQSGAHPLEDLSMGMTNDFEVAVEEGATLVRAWDGAVRGAGRRCNVSRTITVSDELYARLEEAATSGGLDGVVPLLEQLEDMQRLADEALKRRRETVEWIDDLRARMFEKYGEMPDSVGLLREDRER